MTNTNKTIIAVIAIIIIILASFFILSSPEDADEAGVNTVSTSTTSTTTVIAAPVNNSVNTTITVPGGKVIAPEEVTLMHGQTGGTDDFTIFFRDVIGDSRCPKDVRCIQAGWVTADLVLHTGGNEKQVLLKSNGETAVFGGYKVSIIEVAPMKFSGKEITKGSYALTFKIAQ